MWIGKIFIHTNALAYVYTEKQKNGKKARNLYIQNIHYAPLPIKM